MSELEEFFNSIHFTLDQMQSILENATPCSLVIDHTGKQIVEFRDENGAIYAFGEVNEKPSQPRPKGG